MDLHKKVCAGLTRGSAESVLQAQDPAARTVNNGIRRRRGNLPILARLLKSQRLEGHSSFGSLSFRVSNELLTANDKTPFSRLFVVLSVNDATAGQDSKLHKPLAFVAWQLVCHVETQLNNTTLPTVIAKNGFLNCSIVSLRMPVPARPLRTTRCCVSYL